MNDQKKIRADMSPQPDRTLRNTNSAQDSTEQPTQILAIENMGKRFGHDFSSVRPNAPGQSGKEETTASHMAKIDVLPIDPTHSTVVIDGIPVADIQLSVAGANFSVQIDIINYDASIVLEHSGQARLTQPKNVSSSIAYTVRLLEVNTATPTQNTQQRGSNVPQGPGEADPRRVNLIVVSPSLVHWLDEPAKELGVRLPIPLGTFSEFETNLRARPGDITGVVLNPDDPTQIIGYTLPATSGVTKIADREGDIVAMDETGLETPAVDPLDLVPTPGTAAKGAGILGKLALKAAGKKAAAKTPSIAMGVIVRMRNVSKALTSRAARKGLQQSSRLVRKITEEGLEHSFDRHAAEWFGHAATKQQYWGQWRSMIERAATSKYVYPWSLKTQKTVAHLARLPMPLTPGKGRYFVVQFFEETGELATAFEPNPYQLEQAFLLLGKRL